MLIKLLTIRYYKNSF